MQHRFTLFGIELFEEIHGGKAHYIFAVGASRFPLASRRRNPWSGIRDPTESLSASRLLRPTGMSKHINVNPGQYKVAGREKMGKPVDDTRKIRAQAADSRRKKPGNRKGAAQQDNKR